MALSGMRRLGRTVTEAERRAGQRLSVLCGADALADLRLRLADRDGVATTVVRAVTTGRWGLVQTHWMLRWTGPTYHVTLTPAKHGDRDGDRVAVEMRLPDGVSELVLARSADGKMTTNPRALAGWFGLGQPACSAADAPDTEAPSASRAGSEPDTAS